MSFFCTHEFSIMNNSIEYFHRFLCAFAQDLKLTVFSTTVALFEMTF